MATIDRPLSPTNDDPHIESMWATLSLLPAKQRAALVLRFYSDLSNDEIAAALDISSANARLAVHRGLARLRKEARTWMPQ